jgi:hypothetical protein
MAKVYRYMSVKELKMIMNGETVVGQLQEDVRSSTDNKANVCFLSQQTKFKAIGEDHVYTPEQCYEFLGGIVSDEILVEFETSAAFEYGYGRYASPYGFGSSSIYINEYYVPEYSSKDFTILRYGTPGYDFKWNKYSRLAIALRPLTMKVAKWFKHMKSKREYKKLCKAAGIND